MFIEASEISRGATIHADVCVVGAGPAGLTLARELTSSSREICVLESGGFEPELETQAIAQGGNVGLPYYPVDANRQRAFGGTLRLWAGWCRPLDEIDFEQRSWVPNSGWPMTRASLWPYYERAHEVLGLGPCDYDVSRWEKSLNVARIPLPETGLVTNLYHMAEPSYLARTSRDLLQTDANVRVLLHATVVEIEVDDSARSVTRLRVCRLGGNRFWVQAREYVLAAGGIENARLLLASNRQVGNGLGNENDLVGRYFMEHVHFPLGRIHLSNAESVAPSLYFRPGAQVIARLFLSRKIQERQGILNYNVMINPMHSGLGPRLARRLKRVALRLDSAAVRNPFMAYLTRRFLGRAAAAAYRSGLGLGAPCASRFLSLSHTLEQAPNPASRITLGDERDALGIRRVQVDWETTPLDERTASRARAILGEEFAHAGIGVLEYDPEEDETAWPPPPLQGLRGHHMGTTRMHDDPRKGVVDANCRVHSLSNLYVAGSSVFPTSGAGTPTVTIVALAAKLADHLKRTRHESA